MQSDASGSKYAKPAGGAGWKMNALLEAEMREEAKRIYLFLPLPSFSEVGRQLKLDRKLIAAWAKEDGWPNARAKQQLDKLEKDLTKAGIRNRNELSHSIWKGTKAVLKELEKQRKVHGASVSTLSEMMTVYERANRIDNDLRGKLGINSR